MKYRIPLLVALLTLLLASPAHAHGVYGDYGSVRWNFLQNDPDPQLAWVDETKYNSYVAYAEDSWNELDCRWPNEGPAGGPCPGVHIFQDGTDPSQRCCEATLVIRDYSDCSESRWGYFDDAVGRPDYIYLNTCKLDNKTENQKKWLVTHEFGHALGFGHPPCTDRNERRSIMQHNYNCVSQAFPDSHDRDDYYSKWVLRAEFQ